MRGNVEKAVLVAALDKAVVDLSEHFYGPVIQSDRMQNF